MVDECGIILASHLEIIAVRELPTEEMPDSLNAYALQEANGVLNGVYFIVFHGIWRKKDYLYFSVCHGQTAAAAFV